MKAPAAPSRAAAPSAGRPFARVRRDLPGNGHEPNRAALRAEERRLLAAARGGDPRALRALLERVSPTVYRFGRSFCRDPHDADDVMQDVFVALTGSLGRFRGDASLASWAWVVAQRACARRRRTQAVAARTASLDLPREEGGAGEIPDERSDPARLAESRELREVLEAAIRDLPAAQRDVLMLRDVEGLPAREVGRMLGIGERAVKSRLHRARLAVRARVAAYRGGAIPRPSGCPDTPALLSRFLEGEMSSADCAAVERHVSACGWCRGACAALRDTLRSCRRWGSAPVPRALRARLRRAVRAAVSGRPETPRGVRRRAVAAPRARS